MKLIQKQLTTTMNQMKIFFLKKAQLTQQTKYLTFINIKKNRPPVFLDIKKQQTENKPDDEDSINYVDDINFDDVRENKNAKIAAKKITEKYKKLSRKRKQQQKLIAVIVEGFRNPSKKKEKRQQSLHL